MSRRAWLGGALLVASTIGLWIDRPMFLAAWLSAWWWCLGLVLGTFVNAWLHRLTGGRWGEAIRPVAVFLAGRLPWLLLLFLPVLAGLAWLYPWIRQPPHNLIPAMARPAFVDAWLNPPFFIARLGIYALVWWWLARAASIATKGRAAASLIVHSLVTSLAAVDLLMSLLPGWYSTAFGLVVLSNQAVAGAAIATLLAARWTPARFPPAAVGAVPAWRDLGNLLLMWTMTWAYLAFMQFLVIWAEDLPREIGWYVPRLHTGWQAVALALVVVQLAVPTLALLMRSVKDHPRRLAGVAALLLAGSALDSAWTVVPSVAPHSLHAWWLLPLVFIGMAMLLLGGAGAALRGADPRAGEPRGLGHAHP